MVYAVQGPHLHGGKKSDSHWLKHLLTPINSYLYTLTARDNALRFFCSTAIWKKKTLLWKHDFVLFVKWYSKTCGEISVGWVHFGACGWCWMLLYTVVFITCTFQEWNAFKFSNQGKSFAKWKKVRCYFWLDIRNRDFTLFWFCQSATSINKVISLHLYFHIFICSAKRRNLLFF